MNYKFDYQWPQCFLKDHTYSKKDSKKSSNKLIDIIEKFFLKKFKSPVIVFPSARSCIGSILEFENLSRNDEVFVNKWVSNCVFNSVGFYTNPTINFINPKIVLANNNWGLVQKIKLSPKKKGIIVDDSCDSLITDNKNLYPNNSKYEIFSLPKLIGSVAGGIVISKNRKFYRFCKSRQKKNKKLGITQSYLKFRETKKNYDYDFRYKEVTNSYLEYNAAKNIVKNLDNYEINTNIIKKRLNIIGENFKVQKDLKRYGPVILFELKNNRSKNKLKKLFMFRHKVINYKKNLSKQYLLFPVHFKITDKMFNYNLRNILKFKNSFKI